MTAAKIDALPEWDIQDQLKTPQDVAAYLEAVFEDGDPQLIAAALGDVAKAKGMTAIAGQVGITREGLYKALSPKGDPKLSTLLDVFKALGLRLTCAVHAAAAPAVVLTGAQAKVMRDLAGYVGETVHVLTGEPTKTVAPDFVRKARARAAPPTLRGLEKKGFLRIEKSYWKGAEVTVLKGVENG